MNNSRYFVSMLFLIASAVFRAQIIHPFAGNGSFGFSGDTVVATSASLASVFGVAVDSQGNVFFAERSANRIRKVNTAGILSTYAGKGSSGFSGDGGQAILAELFAPAGIAIDSFDNLYIADAENRRIRKVTPAGIITTVAGTGNFPFNGDNISALTANISNPLHVATDNAGNIYISDFQGNRVRKVNSTGIITTLVGNGNFSSSGDGGPANLAEIDGPSGIAIDKKGNIYIAEYNYRVRKINSNGIISTYAGTGVWSATPDTVMATNGSLGLPIDVALDSLGNLYIAENAASLIRKVDSNGVMTRFAGTGTVASTGEGGLAINASLAMPYSLDIDKNGNIYVCETYSRKVRVICNSVCPVNIPNIIPNDYKVVIYPNPTNGKVNVECSGIKHIKVYNITGSLVYEKSFQSRVRTANIELNIQAGIYSIVVESEDGWISSSKLIIHMQN